MSLFTVLVLLEVLTSVTAKMPHLLQKKKNEETYMERGFFEFYLHLNVFLVTFCRAMSGLSQVNRLSLFHSPG